MNMKSFKNTTTCILNRNSGKKSQLDYFLKSFSPNLYTFHFLRLKQKIDSLLFLIKKQNYKKTVGCNDKLSYIMFIYKN